MRQENNGEKRKSSLVSKFRSRYRQDRHITRRQSIRNTSFPRKSIVPVIKINGQEKGHPDKTQREIQQQQNSMETGKSCLKKTKTHQITKKKINFEINYSNFEKQCKTFGNLFIHALNKISCDNNFLQPDKEDPTNKNFPIPIINILYGQNINNYNPYIQALDKVYESFKGKISKQKMQRIKKLCYIGIAKNYFKSQKYSQTPKYRRVNILIRTYMYQNMHSIVEQKAQNYQNIVFIPCNKGALSFSHKKFPQQLRQICSQQFYQTTIQHVNKIIQNHYINYKKMNTKQTVTDRWGQNLAYFLTFLVFVIFLFSKNIIFSYILSFIIVVSIILYIYECRQTLSMLGSSKNIIQKIQSSLTEYLRQINTHNMQWKVGQDFYWLQIHYIRKKKRKQIRHQY